MSEMKRNTIVPSEGQDRRQWNEIVFDWSSAELTTKQKAILSATKLGVV